jgi:oligopeptide transport system substrate-binding protein
MDRTLTGLLAAFGGALLVVWLTFSRTVDEPADFRFSNQSEPKTLDPQLMTGVPEARLADALFEGLTRRDPKTMRDVPGSAESWDISPDGKRYTFHIRENARWTDGHPVTAHDFVYAWKRLLEPSLASEYAYIVFPLRYAEALNTFDAYAETLRTALPRALATLLRDHPSDVGAGEWQAFLAKHQVLDPLRRETDPDVVNLLSRRDGRVSRGDVERLAAKLPGAASRLREEARDARAHFGVDGGVFAADDRTLVVELRAPTPYFLQITSFHSTYPTPRWAIEAKGRGDDWFLPEHIVTNGPFRLKRWLVNDHIRLERSESYWGRNEVGLGAVDAFSLSNETTALNLYLTGALDWIPDHYPKDLSAELRHRSDFYGVPGLVVYYYRFNTKRPPFDDKRVRLALNLAIDRKLLVEQVLGLGQIPAYTFVPPGMAGYEPPPTVIRYDVPHAKALLAEAGFPNGKGFPSVGILYNTDAQHKKIAEEIAEELRQNLGIDVRAYNQEWQSYQTTTRAGNYDLARAAWVGDYTDPNTFLDLWVTGGGNNQTGFGSSRYDRLIRTAADMSAFLDSPEPLLADLAHPEAVRDAVNATHTATDPGARLAALAHARLLLLREAEGILVGDELPIIPLYFYVVSGLVHQNVGGFYSTLQFEDGKTSPNFQDLHPLRDLFIKGSEKTAGAPQ